MVSFILLLLIFTTGIQAANFYNNTITYGNAYSLKVPPYPECQPIYDSLLALNRPWTCVNSATCKIIWVVYGNDLVINWINTNNGLNSGGDFTCTLPDKGILPLDLLLIIFKNLLIFW